MHPWWVTASCNVASILPISKLRQGARQSQTNSEKLGRNSNRTRELGPCSAASPWAAGTHLGAGTPPPPGPSSRGGRQKPGRPPGCRAGCPAASRRGESPRAPAPPPALTNSKLPGNRPRGPAPSAREKRVRASRRVEAVRGSGTCGLTEIKDSDQACSPGGRTQEGSGDCCGSVGVGGQRVHRRRPVRGQGMVPCTRGGVRGALRSWDGAVAKGSEPFL